MLKVVAWTTIALVLALLVWQSTVDEPLWPHALNGLLIAIISLLAGIRIGTDAAAAYMKDLHRTNKVLAEQNEALQHANAMFLKQADAESRTPSEVHEP
jgi:hypothetical protein